MRGQSLNYNILLCIFGKFNLYKDFVAAFLVYHLVLWLWWWWFWYNADVYKCIKVGPCLLCWVNTEFMG